MGGAAVRPGIPATPKSDDKTPIKEEASSLSTERESLANGPLAKRHCTDCLCCGLFLLFLVAWLGAGVFGYIQGDPAVLLYPYDSEGQQCGRPNSVTADFPYLYWPFPLRKSIAERVCVRQCPRAYAAAVDCYNSTDVCELHYETSHSPDLQLGYLPGAYPCKSFLGRFCLPNAVSGWARTSSSVVSAELNLDAVVKWMGDLQAVWTTLLIVAGFALVLAVLYMVLIRFFVGIIVWTSILVVVLMIFSVGAVLLWTAYYLYQNDSQEDTRRTLRICAYITFALGGLFVLYILYMCRRIRLAIAILQSATLFLADVKAALLLPPLFALLTVGLYVYWLLATLAIYSTGEIHDNSSIFPEANMDKTARNIYYFHFFGVLWLNAFISALLEFTLASAVAIWYFALNSDAGAQRPICRSLYRAFRFHLGSIAFGAVVLATVRFLKWVMRYIVNRLKTSQNRVLKLFIAVANCYIACFERGIQHVNRNAYIQIALKSTNFCTACFDAFALVLKNAMTFVTLGSIGGVFMFLGKWSICFLSTYLGFLLLTHADRYSDINSPVFPVIVSSKQAYLLLTYVIASCFMAVYSMAVDAILQCYLLDDELSKARGDFAPRHAPYPLLDFMGKERDKLLVGGKRKVQSRGCC